MGRRLNTRFIGRHRDDVQTHEKVLNNTNHQGNANQNTMRYYLTTVIVAIHGHCQEDTQVTSVGEDVEKRKHSCTVGENVNWCSHYGKQNEAFSKKLKIELPFNPENPLQGI